MGSSGSISGPSDSDDSDEASSVTDVINERRSRASEQPTLANDSFRSGIETLFFTLLPLAIFILNLGLLVVTDMINS